MSNNSKIDNIADIVFSKVDINKKENYKQWKKDKESFREELEISLNEFDNETKKTILLRLEKDAESGQSTFFNSSGNIDIQSIPKITKNIAKQINNEKTNVSQISDANIPKENNMSREEKIEEIKKEFDGFFTKDWREEDKDLFAELMDEAREKKKKMEKCIAQGMSEEDAKKAAKIGKDDEKLLKIDKLDGELKSIKDSLRYLRAQDPKNPKINELEEKQKELEERISELMQQTQTKLQQINELMAQGKTREEAEKAVGWNSEDKKIEDGMKTNVNHEKKSELTQIKLQQINELTAQGKTREETEKAVGWNSEDKKIEDGMKTNVNHEKKSELTQIKLQQTDKQTIINVLDKWTQIITEGAESIEEIEQKIEKLEESSDKVKGILKNLVRDPKLIEALQSEEAMEEYTERLFDIQEQIQENNVELSSELSPSNTNMYALLGISKITDKEMQPMYDASKERLDVTDRGQSHQQEAHQNINQSVVQSTEVDGIYIVNGVQMEVDKEFTKIAMEAQERGEDPEKAILEYYERLEQENAEVERASEDKEEQAEPEIVVVDEKGQVQKQETAKQENIPRVADELGEEKQAEDGQDKNENIIAIKKDKKGKIEVLRPVQFIKKISMAYQQNESKLGTTLPEIFEQHELLAELAKEKQRNTSKTGRNQDGAPEPMQEEDQRG